MTVSLRAFFPPKEENLYEAGGKKLEAGPLMLIPITVFGIINIVLGICPGPIVAFVEKIAQGIL